MKTSLILLLTSLLLSGCTTKAMYVDGKKYTQTWGSEEWQYAGEADPSEIKQSSGSGEKAIAAGLLFFVK